MIKRDYYEVLGIDRNSSEDEIKKAYRRQALKYHPDRNREDHDAEERFKEASEAYEVLSDPDRRQVYDAYGHAGLEGRGFHGFSNVDDIFASMGDIFEEFFGGMGSPFGGSHGGRTRARRGHDIRHDLNISFIDASKGIEKEITVSKETHCDHCRGTGEEPGTGRTACNVCGGMGNVTQRQGFFVIQTVCPACGGVGSKIDKPCKECRGRGRVPKTKKLNVKVPAGIEDGMRLVLRGEGEIGDHGGPPGDLYVFVSVERHEFFERDGDDIICSVPISFPQAALGARIEVPSLESSIGIDVPPGTETGDIIRAKGKGMPSLHRKGHRGDLIVRFVIKTPKKLTRRQRELLEEFMKS